MSSPRHPAKKRANEAKNVRFRSDASIEEVHVIKSKEPVQGRHHRTQERRHGQQGHRCSTYLGDAPVKSILEGKGKDPGVARPKKGILGGKDRDPGQTILPPLFDCKSREDVLSVLDTGKGTITDTFQGYNALQWYCDAKSSSPGILRVLIDKGIDINAVDQRKHTHGSSVIRHTALGFACRNANVKAVHTLLQHGAKPCGTVRSKLPKEDARGRTMVYPSPVQELLCQPIHGPRPGQYPWVFRLTDSDEKDDQYLDDINPQRQPYFRSHIRPKENGVCEDCREDFHVLEPSPATEKEREEALGHRRSHYREQITFLGNRLKACLQLLISYNNPKPQPSFSASDDPTLWSGIDYLLETFWRFFFPFAVCGKMSKSFPDAEFPAPRGQLAMVLSDAVFAPFGEICDMLLDSTSYGDEKKGAAAKGERGVSRLVSLIAAHPERSSFMQGEFFDVDPKGKLHGKNAGKKH
ncbi:hypothetical protein F5Y09DRAFT_356241 [Xylaria sp. FL1042]|nr:hypothetical protein F5Y09DRAFT_356241 [Xylaria sp. FL1042]